LITLDLEDVLAKKGQLIDEEIAKIIPKSSEIPNLNDAIWYILSAGGKRLRPAMGLLVAEALGGNIRQALRFGVAVELVHTFLLIHDDIEDGDVVRRNCPTLWAKYGIPHGVNTGDFVFAKVFESISSLRELGLDDRRILDLFDATTRCLIQTGEGQAMDINARSKNNLSENEYMEITRNKTGSYLTLPMVGAGIISGAEGRVIDALRDYGSYIGPAFQIEDDVIDLTEGKGRMERGCDIKEGKRSFMVVYAAAQCTRKERTMLFEILNRPRETKSSADISWVIKLFNKYDAVAAARDKAESLVIQGKKEVSTVPSKLKDVLYEFADFAVRRSH
jgi:geranylgeranyl diphosphate synthase type I